jgi:hypothetical protein
MPFHNPAETLRDLQPEDLIEIRHRGQNYTLRVVDVDVDTDKPDIYGVQYHILVTGKNKDYRLFTAEETRSRVVTIERNVAKSSHNPVWKCIGSVDRISIIENGETQ